jgi:uncharacterized protein (DUF1697 family)
MGYEDARTYVQSGNIVFRTRSKASSKLATDIEANVAQETGLRNIPVVVRSQTDLQKIATGNPFPTEGIKPTLLHVMFLADSPTRKAIQALDPDRSPPNEFAVKGREIYLWLPKGWARSKLTIDYFEKTLGTRATARNWNTVIKVLDLMKSL